MKRWNLCEVDEKLSLTEQLLSNRGITDTFEQEHFLNTPYEESFHDPFLLKGMREAVDRIKKALARNERIAIYGDYDTDGIPGSTLLFDFLTQAGCKNITVYIPHRYEEGYGMNIPAVETLAAGEVGLIITVDSGITDVEPVARARELGVDVIVTDHHLPGRELPKALAIINPNQPGCTYPFPHLAGGGVAFKLAQALFQEKICLVTSDFFKRLLDLAAISTITDMVPLVGENRAIARFGLEVLRRTKRVGLQQIIQSQKINPTHFSEEDVGFTIGPRLNAASRMDSPMQAFLLLSTRDPIEAARIASFLEIKNQERKDVVARIMSHAESLISPRDAFIVLGHPSWRPGVLGLAAARLAESYKRPVCLWGAAGSPNAKGSCRSWGGYNVTEIMQSLPKNALLEYGGHKASGGFSADLNAVDALPELFSEAMQALTVESHSAEEILIDKTLSCGEVTPELYQVVRSVGPYGVGHLKPAFLFERVVIEKVFSFGKKKEHLRLTISDTTGLCEVISFFWTGLKPKRGERVNLVASPEVSSFGGRSVLRLRMVDLQK
jgi:single-stranded-DNA-specific exonuclease